MIACVSPGFSSANHTINTLRYSDRLKERTSMMKGLKSNILSNIGGKIDNLNNLNVNNNNYNIQVDNFMKENINPISNNHRGNILDDLEVRVDKIKFKYFNNLTTYY